MKMLMTFGKIFLALALLTSAINQTVWAASATPEKGHQDNRDELMVDAPKIGMLPTQQEPMFFSDDAEEDLDENDNGINLDDAIEVATHKAQQRGLTGNPPLVCKRIPQRMAAIENKDEKKTASAKDDKPFACPAAQCDMHCFSADGLLFHMMSVHCSKAVDPTPARIITIKIGDLVCRCNAKKDDRVCRICRCTDHHMSYAAAGMQPPPPYDEKVSDLDGPFTCDYCGANVNKYTCYMHLAADCPKKSVATVVTPSAMEQSHE
jgi:hypothetical protein